MFRLFGVIFRQTSATTEDLPTCETLPPTPNTDKKVATKTATNHTPAQQLIDISSDSVIHKGIPIAIVRVRHKIL